MSFSSSQDRDPVVVHDPPSLPHALARVHSAPSLKHAASMIAAAGFPVFHLIPRGKIPTGGSHGHLDANADPNLPDWPRPDCNVGLRTGAESGVVVLDTDPRHGGDEHLHDLEHEHGEVLPRTLSVKTPGGGAHYYFAHPDVEVPCDRDLAGHRGVDIKADGGYVVVPPSRTDLGVYALDELAPLAPMPGWLVELTTVVDDERGPVDPDEVVTAFVAGIRSGRDPALTQLTGMLLRHFVPVDVTRLIVHAVNRTYCKPPKPTEVVEKIVDSIAGREGQRRGWW